MCGHRSFTDYGIPVSVRGYSHPLRYAGTEQELRDMQRTDPKAMVMMELTNSAQPRVDRAVCVGDVRLLPEKGAVSRGRLRSAV